MKPRKYNVPACDLEEMAYNAHQRIRELEEKNKSLVKSFMGKDIHRSLTNSVLLILKQLVSDNGRLFFDSDYKHCNACGAECDEDFEGSFVEMNRQIVHHKNCLINRAKRLLELRGIK